MERFAQVLLALILEPGEQHDLSMAAAEALVNGMDSSALREAAGRPSADDDETRELFLRAAYELGYPLPGAGDPVLRQLRANRAGEGRSLQERLVVWDSVQLLLPSEDVRRLQAAVELVEHDVRATFRSDERLHLVPVSRLPWELPAFLVAHASGGYYGPGASVELGMSESQTVLAVAECASEMVVELWWVTWPACRVHSGGPAEPTLQGAIPVWRCHRGRHVLAPIGQLLTESVEETGSRNDVDRQ